MQIIFSLLAFLSVILQCLAFSFFLASSPVKLVNYFGNTAMITTLLTHCLVFFYLLAHLPQIKLGLATMPNGYTRYEELKFRRRQLFYQATLTMLLTASTLVILRPFAYSGQTGFYVFTSLSLVTLALNAQIFYREHRFLRECER